MLNLINAPNLLKVFDLFGQCGSLVLKQAPVFLDPIQEALVVFGAHLAEVTVGLAGGHVLLGEIEPLDDRLLGLLGSALRTRLILSARLDPSKQTTLMEYMPARAHRNARIHDKQFGADYTDDLHDVCLFMC